MRLRFGRLLQRLQGREPAPRRLQAFEALPLAPAADLARGLPILFLAPHPDDESLGCGGAIAALCALGVPVFVSVLTDGVDSHPGSRTHPPDVLRDLREAEALAATAALGVAPERVSFHRIRDGTLPVEGAGFEAIVADVARLVASQGIATLCVTWEHDPHTDHHAAAAIAAAVAGRTGARLYAYPVWGWTLGWDVWLPWRPWASVRGLRVQVSHVLERKRAAIARHRSQLGEVITDDPEGFCLDPKFLSLFDRPTEVFVETPARA